MEDAIVIKGAKENNLKNFDLSIPRDKFIVITGVSGSGKSSLAFDTLYAEGHRRFAESLSSFARQFLGRMAKPDVDLIAGIPPAIAVGQKVNSTNPRSTVATSTEIYEYLRVLYAKIGHTFSPISGKEVTCDSSKSIFDHLKSLPEGSVAVIAAKIEWGGMEKTEKLMDLKESGFSRVIAVEGSACGEIYKIDDILSKKHQVQHESLALLIDRILVNNDEDFATRVFDSANTAFKEGKGYVYAGENGNLKSFSNLFEADGIRFEEPNETL
ncbi:MAG: excinuclease ABC subunit A, partial [Bacteroidales bacterium]|nr:excinuclease ABC subunit A [Bacteroidales bacterium]